MRSRMQITISFHWIFIWTIKMCTCSIIEIRVFRSFMWTISLSFLERQFIEFEIKFTEYVFHLYETILSMSSFSYKRKKTTMLSLWFSLGILCKIRYYKDQRFELRKQVGKFSFACSFFSHIFSVRNN